jgi:hypothetical protein
MLEQHRENLEWLLAESDLATVLEELRGTQIRFEHAEPNAS